MFQEVLQRRRELWRWGMQWPAIRSWQRPIERIIEAKLLTTTREAAQELIDHSTVIWHLKQTGKVKNLYNWCLTSWPKIKKIGVFQRHLLLFCTTTMNHFSNEWFEKSGLYTTTGNDQLSDWTKKKTKHVPKPSVHQKKVMITVWGSAALWFNTALWIWQNYYIWEVCSANQWDAPKTATAAPGIGQQNGPNSFARCELLPPHIHLISHQPTTISSISTTFCRENTAIISKRQEMLS